MTEPVPNPGSDEAAELGSMTPVLLRAVEAMLPFALFAKRLRRDGHKTTVPRLRRGRHGRARWELRRMDTEPRVWQGQPASAAAVARYMKAGRYRRRIDPRRRRLMSKNRRSIDTSAGHVEGVDG